VFPVHSAKLPTNLVHMNVSISKCKRMCGEFFIIVFSPYLSFKIFASILFTLSNMRRFFMGKMCISCPIFMLKQISLIVMVFVCSFGD
jgi:hypothetical protein